MMMLLRRQVSAMRPCVGAASFATHRQQLSYDEPGKKRKVKVALVTGYTGTGYHGVQIQENAVDVPTIEHEVRAALFKAGCILESNYGDMSKIGCGRIAHLPAEINAHLPADIRVFTATKVHQSFRAREDCILREYEYFLPLSFLSSLCPPGMSVDDAAKAFIKTLPRFEGIHDFHNFTKQRRFFYKQLANKQLAKQRRRLGETGDDVETFIEHDEVDDGEHDPPSTCHQETDISVENGVRKSLQRHRRTIYACRGTLVPDMHGEPYVHIHLTGASFLLNQIRCMVGAAMAVATGAMTPSLFDAALRTNQVVSVPTAPAEGLVLSSCGFGAKQHLISLLRDHNTPRNLSVTVNPNQAPHRVLVSDTDAELHQMLRFRNEVIYKEVARMWRESDLVAAWPEHFASWSATLNAQSNDNHPEILAALQTVLENDAGKAANSERVVREARVTGDALKVLPRGFNTAVCIHFGITPGVYVTDVVAGVKRVH
ncbi:hypothetical protein DYB30_008432 [Aphanomyces astaci]|uniref:tRNA pseudouridine synthase n=3 Tax=Aphanomyces astaci TaxID=112090 RepID=A0A397DZ67_APHAT|nr:hypothetical protein DYB30_008432 [Aphanomyces astaci]RHZ38803.1 hypothetical protein DYB26_003488 [Aphanomyces astaci]